jgi:hypothetical protein
MELGCGLATKIVHGRRYFYFWRYGKLNGASKKVERYVGPVGAAQTGEKAVRMLLEHAVDAKEEVDLRLARYRRALERMRRI